MVGSHFWERRVIDPEEYQPAPLFDDVLDADFDEEDAYRDFQQDRDYSGYE